MTCSRRRFASHVARALVVAASPLAFGAAYAQSALVRGDASGEARIKAAFICKFGNYVDWGKDGRPAESAFVIGVVGGGRLLDELNRAASGQTVNGRPIVVRRLEKIDPVDDVAIVFVGRGNLPAADSLASMRGRPILTITESDDAAPGSMINFVIVDDRVRFDIALPQAEQGGLKISGRLLALARKVTGAPS